MKAKILKKVEDLRVGRRIGVLSYDCSDYADDDQGRPDPEGWQYDVCEVLACGKGCDAALDRAHAHVMTLSRREPALNEELYVMFGKTGTYLSFGMGGDYDCVVLDVERS